MNSSMKRVVVVVAAACVVVAGCADSDRSKSGTHLNRPNVVHQQLHARGPAITQAPPRTNCRGGGAFADASASEPGAGSPLGAARRFVAVHGYGTITTRWTVGVRDRQGGVTLRAGLFWLHATRRSDSKWVIDSGGRCT
jgi:hypothetical protein